MAPTLSLLGGSTWQIQGASHWAGDMRKNGLTLVSQALILLFATISMQGTQEPAWVNHTHNRHPRYGCPHMSWPWLQALEHQGNSLFCCVQAAMALVIKVGAMGAGPVTSFLKGPGWHPQTVPSPFHTSPMWPQSEPLPHGLGLVTLFVYNHGQV